MTHPIDQERLRIARDICALVALENPDTAAIFARVDKESFRVDHAERRKLLDGVAETIRANLS